MIPFFTKYAKLTFCYLLFAEMMILYARKERNYGRFTKNNKYSKILSKQFEQKLLGNNLGITKDSPLYLLYQDISRGVGTYSAYYDTPLREKLGGVALFIAQEKRAVAKGLISDFTYDNEYEMEEILRLSQEFHDPQTSGYYVKAPSEKEATYVAHQPSPRQLLLEEIMNEFKKRSKKR